MSAYSPPLDDVRFLLTDVTAFDELQVGPYAELDRGLVDDVLAEAGRFAAEVVAPTNRAGDLAGARLVDGEVVMPPGLVDVYQRYTAAGWGAISLPSDLGGGGMPTIVGNVVREFMTSANAAFSLCPLLNGGAVRLLHRHASAEQIETYARLMVSGEWAGTMALTEPNAGSDVGASTMRAVAHPDGSYRVSGQKIFLTYGDHGLTDQIVHLVLARLPDAPAGTAGLSLFIVPKRLVAADSSLGELNDLRVVSLEHKLGIHASPTCVMVFGDATGGAVGELIGSPNQGMRQMFTMMNDARLAVGIQGVGIAERAYQQAVAYARMRRQGRRPDDPPDVHRPIIDHPDVRRMLLTQKACIEAARALCFANAHAIDLGEHASDPHARDTNQRLADLLTPLSKAWATDLGVELTSMALQVHGGMGYVEETGVAQHLRDVRITPIYEGTNGIQALDLVGRKLRGDEGRAVLDLLGRIRGDTDAFATPSPLIGRRLRAAVDAAHTATSHLLEDTRSFDDVAAAASPYLRMLATLVGGWLLARSAHTASRRLAARDIGPFDAPFLGAKVTTARFYATALLPQVTSLGVAVLAGGGDVMELADDDFAR